MAQGPHVHEWKYNEAEIYRNDQRELRQCTVVRFCVHPGCLEVEEVELKVAKKK